jgi:hypothetical protein
MGQDAECECECNGARTKVKALIEPPDLILRGAIRRRLPFSRMEQIRVDGDKLRFSYQGETFSLTLGNVRAQKWAKSLTTPPPSLAKKLGIAENTVVRMVGPVDDEPLRAALSAAKTVASEDANLILARVNTPEELANALRVTADQLAARVPIWFIYPKGKGHALTESDVRSTALAAGIVDTKVAAVSPALTGLRFVRRRSDL